MLISQALIFVFRLRKMVLAVNSRVIGYLKHFEMMLFRWTAVTNVRKPSWFCHLLLFFVSLHLFVIIASLIHCDQ